MKTAGIFGTFIVAPAHAAAIEATIYSPQGEILPITMPNNFVSLKQ